MEKVEIKVDRRIKKTKKAIRNAFTELIAQKDINKITVKEIADVADINRKTFYSHYDGVYQIIDEIENELVSVLNEIIGDIDLKRDLENPEIIFAKLTSVINHDLDFYGHLLRMDSASNLVPKLILALKEKVRKSFSAQTDIDPQSLDIMTEFIFSGMFAVYKNWFNFNQEQSIESVSEVISVLATFGAIGILEKKNR